MEEILSILDRAVGITADSRKVKPGYIYFAVKGEKFNGNDFIDDVIKKGAIAVVTEDISLKGKEKIIITDNVRRDIAVSASKFYKNQPKYIVAVTGTDGKTSTVNLCRQIWQLLGKRAVSIGTMGIQIDSRPQSSLNTSPDPIALHRSLAKLVEYDVDYVAIEASSIGIDQNRLDGLNLIAAGFTSFTRDHLDYHKTMEQYFHSKLRLFRELLPKYETAVLNIDILKEYLSSFTEIEGSNILPYGYEAENGLKLLEVNTTSEGLNIKFKYGLDEYFLQTNLFGKFQAYNILCAIGLVLQTGVSINEILPALKKLEPIAGRLQQVRKNIFVDYAHTPDSLQSSINSLRDHTENKLIVIFGCGGDRDKGKRPLMAQAAEKYGDIVIVADDNPRSENPETIRDEVIAGFSPEFKNYYNIGDRGEAIKKGISLMEEGDVLLIAGKGHENYQIIGDKKTRFSDIEEVEKLIPEENRI